MTSPPPNPGRSRGGSLVNLGDGLVGVVVLVCLARVVLARRRRPSARRVRLRASVSQDEYSGHRSCTAISVKRAASSRAMCRRKEMRSTTWLASQPLS